MLAGFVVSPHVFFQQRAYDGSGCILIAWRQCRRSAMEEGITKEQPTIYIGIDISKDKLAVATADGRVPDEVISLGTVENAPASVKKIARQIWAMLTKNEDHKEPALMVPA